MAVSLPLDLISSAAMVSKLVGLLLLLCVAGASTDSTLTALSKRQVVSLQRKVDRLHAELDALRSAMEAERQEARDVRASLELH